jgi:hypothetical protein
MTNRTVVLWRVIYGEEDPGQFDGLCPVLPVASTQHSSKEARYLGDQTAFQHERHLPSRLKTSGSGKPRYGLPDAPLAVCSLVSASPSTNEDRDLPSFSPFSLKVLSCRRTLSAGTHQVEH